MNSVLSLCYKFFINHNLVFHTHFSGVARFVRLFVVDHGKKIVFLFSITHWEFHIPIYDAFQSMPIDGSRRPFCISFWQPRNGWCIGFAIGTQAHPNFPTISFEMFLLLLFCGTKPARCLHRPKNWVVLYTSANTRSHENYRTAREFTRNYCTDKLFICETRQTFWNISRKA